MDTGEGRWVGEGGGGGVREIVRFLQVLKMRFKFCGDIDPPEWLLSEIGLISRIVRCN